jgi:hypothetical protein
MSLLLTDFTQIVRNKILLSVHNSVMAFYRFNVRFKCEFPR